MNGGADLGGMMGFGPVLEEPNEPNFHANWESRILGMTVALGACGQWNIDQSRYARESMQPANYMLSSYYEIWFEGLTRLLIERNMVNNNELKTGKLAQPPIPIKRTLQAADVMPVLMAGGPADREVQSSALFCEGDHVRTINHHPNSHTRLPRYARDKKGVITKVHGVHVYPDSSSQGLGEDPQWLYQVSFKATTLWGENKNHRDLVSLDLWQPYLQATL